jgi:ACS family glucarate transporter-like MFS transporter
MATRQGIEAAAVIGRWMPSLNRARAWAFCLDAPRSAASSWPVLIVPIQVRYGWQASCCHLFGFFGVIWAIVWYAWFRDSPPNIAATAASTKSSSRLGTWSALRH